jgi:hypothetical protein
MPLSAVQKLDKVLKILNINQRMTIAEISAQPIINLTADDIILILQKLVKDNYVKRYQPGKYASPFTETTYKITFEGNVFIEQGGYVNEAEAKALEKTRIESLAAYQLEQSDTLNRLTKWIALASCIAAVYYLYFLIQSLCSCEFVWQK